MRRDAFRRRPLLERVWPAVRFPAAGSRPAIAVIAPDMCAGWMFADCRLCEAACPLPGAVRFVAVSQGPFIDASVCDGCGRCILACEREGSEGAIRLRSR